MRGRRSLTIDARSKSGNEDAHKGFGHIAISVDNIDAACKRFEDMGVQFQKKLTDGKMCAAIYIVYRSS